MRSHRESNKQVSLEEEARGTPALLPTRIAFGGFLGWAERQLTAENGGGRREVGGGRRVGLANETRQTPPPAPPIPCPQGAAGQAGAATRHHSELDSHPSHILSSLLRRHPSLLAKCQRSGARTSQLIPDHGQLLLRPQGTADEAAAASADRDRHPHLPAPEKEQRFPRGGARLGRRGQERAGAKVGARQLP